MEFTDKTIKGFFTRQFFELYKKKGNFTTNMDCEAEIIRTTLLPFLLLDLSYNDFNEIDKTKYRQKSKMLLGRVGKHTGEFWKDFWFDYRNDKDAETNILELMDDLEDKLKNTYKLLNLSIMKHFTDIEDLQVKKDIAKIEVYAIFLQIANRMFNKIIKKPLRCLDILENETSSLGNSIFCDFEKDNKKIELDKDSNVASFVGKIIDDTMEFITSEK